MGLGISMSVMLYELKRGKAGDDVLRPTPGLGVEIRRFS